MEIVNYIDDAYVWITTLIGSASLIVMALKKIAKITPTKKDDVWLGKAQVVLGRIAYYLDVVALNPDEEEARKKNKET